MNKPKLVALEIRKKSGSLVPRIVQTIKLVVFSLLLLIIPFAVSVVLKNPTLLLLWLVVCIR